MVRVTLTRPNGDYLTLDTPDPALIGPWLMAIFKDLKIQTPMRIPIEWRIRIDG